MPNGKRTTRPGRVSVDWLPVISLNLGFTNVFLYADPERDITLSLLTSGKPMFAPGVLRVLSLLQVIAWVCRATGDADSS